MAEYLPLHMPGDAITRTASAAITAGQLVYVSGSGTVAPTSGQTPAWLGVASKDTASGDLLGVFTDGTHKLVAGTGGVTAGDLLVSGANGTVVTLGAVTTPTAADVTGTRNIVGVALTTAAATALVEVQLVH